MLPQVSIVGSIVQANKALGWQEIRDHIIEQGASCFTSPKSMTGGNARNVVW